MDAFRQTRPRRSRRTRNLRSRLAQFLATAAVITALASAQSAIILPSQGTEVHAHDNWIILLQPTQGRERERVDTAVILLDANGVQKARFLPGTRDSAYRRVYVYDANFAPDGRVVVAGSALLSMQEETSLIWIYDPKQPDRPPGLIITGSTSCASVTATEDGVWCLGFDRLLRARNVDFPLITKFLWDNSAMPLMPHSKSPKPTATDADFSLWDRSSIGPPVLMAPNSDLLYAWLPVADTLLRYSATRGTVQILHVPFERAGRSVVSVAALPDGRIITLIPLRAPGDGSEQLTQPYGFYELGADARAWRRLAELGTVPRGTQLVGSRQGQVAIWLRGERKLRWLSVP